MKLKIRIRPCEGNLAKLWLIGIDGQAATGLAHGVISQQMAETVAKIAQGCLMEVERSIAGMPAEDEPKPATEKVRQEMLFKED